MRIITRTETEQTIDLPSNGARGDITIADLTGLGALDAMLAGEARRKLI